MKFLVPQSYIDDGLIRIARHPTLDLRLYNYTEHCQFEKKWDDITLACRGLIVDRGDNIVARPFKKFFNYEEHQGAIPSETPEIIEKVDGSLGIVFFFAGEWHVATRGSFTSEQAEHGKMVLFREFNHVSEQNCGLSKADTHLFEIVYPANRIVVDYAQRDELVYLGSIDTETGDEYYAEGVPFHSPARIGFPGTDLSLLRNLPSDNSEGFVLRWPNGFRLKIKFEEYKRLHRILTNTTERTLWEAMSKGESMDKILEAVPDEFYEWVAQTTEDIGMKFYNIREETKAEYERINDCDRKAFAEQATKWKYPGLLFALYDGRDPADQIWKLIKPPATKPFKIEN